MVRWPAPPPGGEGVLQRGRRSSLALQPRFGVARMARARTGYWVTFGRDRIKIGRLKPPVMTSAHAGGKT
eukprot:scaffold16630_cov27-Tisochrysis_lutea.AAC.1